LQFQRAGAQASALRGRGGTSADGARIWAHASRGLREGCEGYFAGTEVVSTALDNEKSRARDSSGSLDFTVTVGHPASSEAK
jgi:hypothetical protein